MCRFALVKTSQPTKPQAILNKFAQMAKNSPAPDGDIQGDGWGIAWQENESWQRFVSIDPIWQETDSFNNFPATKTFLVHARSASFDHHKNNANFNQPYINDNFAFVFNGLVKGVKFPRPLTGKIGAQKIWSLLQEHLNHARTGAPNPQTALEKTTQEINKYSTQVQSLNIGLADGENFYVYNQFNSHPDYYTIHQHQTPDITIIASQPLEGLEFSAVEPKKVIVLS